MSSWERSACYPRSTFYPLSDGPSTRKPPDHYVLLIAPVRPVGLAVKHPYAIALYRRLPSVLRVPLKASVTLLEATTPVKLPTKRCPPLKGLESRYKKGCISRMTPPCLATEFQSLQPILHILHPDSALSCSKGSRGLSVPQGVPGIFTGTTISPSSRLRQYSDRYTIRAGRNLPDKEFRYLRTVIVTAAVYWGFDSMLLHYCMTSPLNLPAPGRCQAIYFVFRICIALCF